MFSKKANLVLIFLFSLLTFSQPGEEYEIIGLRAEGNEFVAKQTIIRLSELKVGDKVKIPYDDKISNAITNLWNRKQFSYVDIKIGRFLGKGVELIIEVKENPRLSSINIFGNEKLDRSEIMEIIPKNTGDIISGYDLYLIKEDILALYKEEDLNFASIDIEEVDTDTLQYVSLDIYIDEGDEFKVSKIYFNGINKFKKSELAGAFDETHENKWWKFWQSSDYNEEEYQTDLDLLRSYFRTKGFIDASIIKDTVIYDNDTKEVTIEIDIDEGDQVFLRNIDFRGNTVFKDKALIDRLEFEPGDIYDVERFDMNLNLNQEQTDAKSLYNNTGYLFAEFIKNENRFESDSVDILIDVFENDRAKVRKVNIIGNDKTKDKVIRRELFVRPGDYFSRSSIIRSVNALNALSYFNPEKLRPDVKPVPGDNTAVDIEFTVEEQSTDTFNASVGFAGTFGFTGSIGLTFNNFSFFEPLKGGGGEVLNFNWERGFRNFQNFTLGYTKPWLFDEPTTVGFSIFDSRLNFVTNFRRTGISGNIGRRFSWPDDYFRANWSLRVQQNDIDDRTAFFRPGQYWEITLGQTISRTSIDNQFFATQGSNFVLRTDFAMGAIGIGQTDFVKTELTYDIYNPVMKIADQNRMVFTMGAKLGYIEGIETDSTISPIELYRMGGNALGGVNVEPLRGYNDRQVGDEAGKVLAKFKSELRFAISLAPMPIYVYTFAEAGNVWSNFRRVDPFQLNRSAGVGFQMFLNPIGLIGFSYGYGFDNERGQTEPNGWKFLIHVGQF